MWYIAHKPSRIKRRGTFSCTLRMTVLVAETKKKKSNIQVDLNLKKIILLAKIIIITFVTYTYLRKKSDVNDLSGGSK